MVSYKNLLFDLDGTLTDSESGMIHAYKYALNKSKVEVPSNERLKDFIGRPLRVNLAECVPADKVAKALQFYYECYDEQRLGFTENKLYDGIRESLEALKKAEKRLYLVSTKPKELAGPILSYFDIEQFFDGVYGSRPECGCIDKGCVTKRTIREEGLVISDTIVIGDRHYDVQAAKDAGLKSVGVTWGYGSCAELKACGADYIVDTLDQLVSLFTEETACTNLEASPLRRSGSV